MGGGTTDYVVYADGVVKHVGVLAVGGDHVSNDLAYGLKVPLGRAEQLKIEHGRAFVDPAASEEIIPISNEVGLPLRTVNLGNLRRIMSVRLEEVFELIAQDLDQAGLLDYLRAGAFLCGGCSRIPSLPDLAERVLRMPVTVGKTHSISGLKSALDQPEFATAIGLVKFGSFQQRKRAEKLSLADEIKTTIGQLFRRA
jgi:cell division protein FtsA